MAIKALMVDLSSNNGEISGHDLEAHYTAGYRVLGLKATQSTTYQWTPGGELARIWHTLGEDALVWRYHFNGTTGSAPAQASYFATAIEPTWRHGDRWALDVENIPIGQGKFAPSFTGAQSRGFEARMHDLEPTWDSAIYGSPYLLRDKGVKPHHGAVLWLADYAASIAFVPPGWDTVAAWQYTDRATGVPGIGGAMDRSTLDPSVMPVQHKDKAVSTALSAQHRSEAVSLLNGLRSRHRSLKNAGDRHLLTAIGNETRRVLKMGA